MRVIDRGQPEGATWDPVLSEENIAKVLTRPSESDKVTIRVAKPDVESHQADHVFRILDGVESFRSPVPRDAGNRFGCVARPWFRSKAMSKRHAQVIGEVGHGNLERRDPERVGERSADKLA